MPRYIDDSFYETLKNNTKTKKGIKGYPFFYVIMLFLVFLSLDLLFKYINYGSLFNADIIHVLLFDLTWSVIFVFLVLLLPEFMRKMILFTLVFFVSLVSIGESFSNDLFYGVSSLLNRFDISDILKLIPIYINEIRVVNLYFFIPVLIFILSVQKVRLKSTFIKRIMLLLVGIFMILGTGIYTSSPQFNNDVEINTNYDKFISFEEMDLVASRLGVTTFTIRNISDVFANSKYNLDINTSLLTQLEIYLERKITNKTNSNILANKNLIMIQVDNLDYMALKDDVMPTLNRLKNEGMFFENFYSTYLVGNGDTEFAVQTSIIPTSKTSNLREFRMNDFPDSMGSLFNELRYSTFTIYDNDDLFNVRNNFYLNEGYAVRKVSDSQSNEWKSSHKTINETSHYYLNESKFFANYVLSNTNYTLDNPVVDKYYQDFQEFDVDEKIKYYYATCKELDTSLDNLLLDLTMSNKINNTVIVVFGTHSSLFEDEKIQLSNIDRSELDIFKTPLIIWTPSINHMPVNKYIGPLDLLPTLANMFGLPANYDNYIGNDVFSENNTVYFRNRSWVNEVGEYDSLAQEFIVRDKKYMTDFLKIYIRNTNEIIEQKFTFSRVILERNYFIQIKV